MKPLRAGPIYVEALIDAAQYAALVANYCDHVEHNEPAEQWWVTDSARGFRSLALRLALEERMDPLEAYAMRVRAIEERSVHHSQTSFDGPSAVRAARTWRELQLAQLQHDRYYHPDVVGLSKLEQLRHYALHLTKLAGALSRYAADTSAAEEFRHRRLPDMLLFGVKLSTVMGEALSEDALEHDGGYTPVAKQSTLGTKTRSPLRTVGEAP